MWGLFVMGVGIGSLVVALLTRRVIRQAAKDLREMAAELRRFRRAGRSD